MGKSRNYGRCPALAVAMRAAALMVALLAPAVAAVAEMASAWDVSISSRARLIAGQVLTPGGPELFAGIEIHLQDGWKTYWRNPGDSGIPPRFDWTGSTNLAAAQILYPAPHRYPDPAGQSIGYKKSVVFPVRLTPTDPGAPIHIRLKMDYAACAELCVPAEADLQLKIVAGSELAGSISEALGRVPRQSNGAGDLPRVGSVVIEGEGSTRKIALTVVQPRGAQDADLFVEGPASWYLPLPALRESRAMGDLSEITYEIALDELPISTLVRGETLRVTVVNGAEAVEQDWVLR